MEVHIFINHTFEKEIVSFIDVNPNAVILEVDSMRRPEIFTKMFQVIVKKKSILLALLPFVSLYACGMNSIIDEQIYRGENYTPLRLGQYHTRLIRRKS